MNEISWKMIFDGWSPVLRTLVLGTLAYVALVVLLRLSGKRSLSKMNAFDFVVTVAFGSTLASILTSRNVSLVQGVVALSLLILLQLISTWLAIRWPWYKRLIKAQPTLIFYQGDFLIDAMRRVRVTEDEILAAMRQHGITDPKNVGAVVIETEGSLSIMRGGVESCQALQQVGIDVDDAIGRRHADHR